jgi:NusA N-terminal domain
MANPISANKAELLAIANAVATEKMIDKAIVIEALEEAIQRAARPAIFACGAWLKWLKRSKIISSRLI